MKTTLDLLARALQDQTNGALASKLDVYQSAFTKSRERGRLSPMFAGQIAQQLGDDVTFWIALAALEAQPPSTARDKLERAIRKERGREKAQGELDFGDRRRAPGCPRR